VICVQNVRQNDIRQWNIFIEHSIERGTSSLRSILSGVLGALKFESHCHRLIAIVSTLKNLKLDYSKQDFCHLGQLPVETSKILEHNDVCVTPGSPGEL
jgi:hypothetical protein